MRTMSVVRRGSLVLAFVLASVGAGCAVPNGVPGLPKFGADKTTGPVAEANALSLKLKNDSKITIQPTVLGVGSALFVERRTDVSVKSWKPRDKAELAWTRTEKVESAASKKARADWKADQTPSPIGVKTAPEPQPVYESVVKKGDIDIRNLRDSESNFLPAFWPEGAHAVADNGVIFLSDAVYQSLKTTRTAAWHPGLFENPFGAMLEISDAIIAQIADVKQKTQNQKDAGTIKANEDYGTFRLTVDGVKKDVRTFTARDAAAEYVVLDNRDNPIILKATLNPISSGVVDILTPLGVLKAFAGYEVTEVTLGQ